LKVVLAEETVEEAGKRKQDNNGTSASHSGSAKRPKGPERPKSSLNKVAVSAVHTSTQVGARREEDIQTEEQEKVMALYAQGLRQLPTVRQYGVDSKWEHFVLCISQYFWVECYSKGML